MVAAATWPEARPAEPGRLDHDDGAQPGRRPVAPGGDPGRPAPPGPAAARPRRTGGGRSRARRPAPARLHVLPPGARPAGPGRADPAAAVRAHDARDRPRVPRARGDRRAADRPGEEEDRRRPHPVPGPGGRRAARPAAAGARRGVPRSSPRGTATTGDDLLRPDLCARGGPARPAARRADARRARGARPARAHAAHRRPAARPAAADGTLVLLADQDRSRWDRALVAEGQALVRALPAPHRTRAVPDPGGHRRRPRDAVRPSATDWGQILGALRPAARAAARRRWWR